MDFTFSHLLIVGLLVASANVLGALILLPSGIYKNYRKWLRYLLALGAGFMLAITFFEMIPKTILIWSKNQGVFNEPEQFYVPMILILVGYLSVQFFEHTIVPHFHFVDDAHDSHTISTHSAYTAIAGLMVHTLFDGVSVSAAAQVDTSMGILMFVAIFLHKIPEGFAIASLVLASGKSFRQVLVVTSLVGLTTLVGVLGYYMIGSQFQHALGYALPLAAGITLYVAASDLIPEVNHHGGKNSLVSFSVFAGVALFFAMHFVLHTFIGG
ncbi:MAG: ZIP family metal transporter [Pyrinomonadaceae bacterium]